MIVKILLTIIFLVVMVGVGVYSRKQASSVDGLVLGGRSVGPWLTAFAYGTSYFSAVVFVGYAGQFGWKYGLSSTWIGVGNALIGSLLAWLVLGRRTKLMTQHIESRTMPDFFGTRFDSQGLRVVASIIAFVFLIPYTAGVYKGISTLFEMGFGIPYEYCVIIMAVLTAIYVILGGYKATAMNDFVQGVIMLFGIIIVIAAVLNTQGGLTTAIDKMAALPADTADSGSAVVANGGFASWFGPDPWGLLGVVILTSLGTWGLPQMVGKFYSITDESAIKRGTVISTVFALIVAGGCYFLGGFGRLFGMPPVLPNGKLAFDSIVPSMLVTLPDVIIALPHWGIEYQTLPSKAQKDMAKWLLEHGVDHIIGGHPHVAQPIELLNNKQNLIAWSMGNVVSNQSKPNTYGGYMVRLEFTKNDSVTVLSDHNYSLYWVSRPPDNGYRHQYRILPIDYPDSLLTAKEKTLRSAIRGSMRRLMKEHGKGEIKEFCLPSSL